MNQPHRFTVRPAISCALSALLLLLVGCQPAEQSSESTAPDARAAEAQLPALETHADSLAMHALEACGSPEAWAALPYLGFEFAYKPHDGDRNPGRKHLWNRMTGDYRAEWRGGEDSTYVILFNVNSQEGTAHLNGAALSVGEQADMVRQAYRGFINDTYWLLMPVKLLDEGVNRAHAPDSSNAATDALQLTFGDVGLTPGDTYWVFINKATGMVERWAYILENRKDQPPTHWTWAGHETYASPAGPLHLATRKVGSDGTLFTDGITMPAEVPADMFTDPNPRL